MKQIIEPMIQVITEHNIDDIMKNPTQYIDADTDIVLLKIFGAQSTGPVVLMAGYDPDTNVGDCDGLYYILEEDNEVCIYHYCTADELHETYCRVLTSNKENGPDVKGNKS